MGTGEDVVFMSRFESIVMCRGRNSNETHLENADCSLTVLSIHIVGQVETADHIHYAQKLFQMPCPPVSRMLLEFASHEAPVHSPRPDIAHKGAKRGDDQENKY